MSRQAGAGKRRCQLWVAPPSSPLLPTCARAAPGKLSVELAGRVLGGLSPSSSLGSPLECGGGVIVLRCVRAPHTGVGSVGASWQVAACGSHPPTGVRASTHSRSYSPRCVEMTPGERRGPTPHHTQPPPTPLPSSAGSSWKPCLFLDGSQAPWFSHSQCAPSTHCAHQAPTVRPALGGQRDRAVSYRC